MARFRWTSQYSVGVESLDQQHKRLIGMLNQLQDAIEKHQERGILQPLLAGIAQFAAMHFATEERLLSQAGYAGLAKHKEQHAELGRKLAELRRRCEAGEQGVALEALEFLTACLNKHIAHVDKHYAPTLAAARVR